MRGIVFGSAGLLMCAAVIACTPSGDPAQAPAQSLTSPSGVPSTGTGALAIAASGRSILMLDQCEPESFDAAVEPGTCVRNGGITFEHFIAALTTHQTVPSWRFSPDTIHVPHEVTLPIVNKGGETHTFTEVEEFGGGIVPVLNALTGNPIPAPECLQLTGADFIPAGGEATHTFEPGETEKYMCCIHPWMRAETR